jgi:hypothetical protein
LDKIRVAIEGIHRLDLFGLAAVSLMLIFYAAEDRSRHFVLAFAGACAMGSVYGFLQGAWPFGLVESIWALVALRRWWMLRPRVSSAGPSQRVASPRGH